MFYVAACTQLNITFYFPAYHYGQDNIISLSILSSPLVKMACKRRGRKKKHGARKKVIRKGGKRYYRAGKSGLVRLKGGKKPPFKRR